MSARPLQSTEGGARSMQLSFRLVRGVEALAGLQAAWTGLEGASGEPDFFQSFAWSMQVAEAKSRALPKHYEALAVVAEDAAGIHAIWPLSRQHREGGWQLRSIDDPFGQFSGVLARDEIAAREVVGATIELARSHKLAGVLLLERVAVGSVLHEAMAAYGAKAGAKNAAPYVMLGEHASIAAFKGTLNKKSMKNQRNALHRIERMGAIAHLRPKDFDAAATVVQHAVANRAQWLEATGTMSPAFRDPAFMEVVCAAGRWGLGKRLVAFDLRAGGVSLAQQFGYLHGGRYYAYLSGMNRAHQDLSPGRVHLAMVLEAAMADGVTAAELLTPASDYKMMWTDRARQLVDMTLPLSARGRLRQAIWIDGLRPLAKSAFYALPVGLRRSVAGLMRGRGRGDGAI